MLVLYFSSCKFTNQIADGGAWHIWESQDLIHSRQYLKALHVVHDVFLHKKFWVTSNCCLWTCASSYLNYIAESVSVCLVWKWEQVLSTDNEKPLSRSQSVTFGVMHLLIFCNSQFGYGTGCSLSDGFWITWNACGKCKYGDWWQHEASLWWRGWVLSEFSCDTNIWSHCQGFSTHPHKTHEPDSLLIDMYATFFRIKVWLL